MKKNICAKLFEPSTSIKKRAALACLSTGVENKPIDIEYIKQELKQQRQKSVVRMRELAEQFLDVLQTVGGGTCHYAKSGRDAAAIVKQAIGDTHHVFANNSGTVQEISDSLTEQGIEVSYNYLAEHSIPENRVNYPWLQPEFSCDVHEDWFSTQKRFHFNGESKPQLQYKTTALIGVNSASASDGTLFLLQHSSNIEKLLQAKRIVFLIGLEKLVENQEQAKFQTRWAGNFGLRNLILSLEKKKAEGSPRVEKVANLATESASGGPEVTFIVLDNGRTNLLGTEFESVLHCISCRSCMRECPTYKFFGKQYGRYPQQYLFYYLIGKLSNIDLCSFCNNCSYECPVGIDVAKMNSLAKGRAHNRLSRLKTRLLGNAELLAGSTKLMHPLSEPLFANDHFKVLLDKTVGIHRNRQLPVYDKIRKREHKSQQGKAKTLIYYAGCWASFFEHEVYNATVKFFECLGYELIIAANKCCGLPLIASGEITAAKKKANALVPKLLELDQETDIITSCPSCSLALKKDYRDLGIDGADKLESRVYDVLEYILSLEEVKGGEVKFRDCDEKLAYHLPCHQRVQDLGHVAIEVLKLIPGLSVEDVDRGCCGISGAWGQKKQFYDYSMVTGNEVFEPINENGFTAVATECGTCKLQMVHGTGLKTLHPILLLADHVKLAEEA